MVAPGGCLGDLINPLPKFVASRTLQKPLTWNGTLIEGDVAEGRAEVLGSPRGVGPRGRPFEGEQIRMQLLDSKAFDSGLMLHRYQPAQGA